MPQTVLSLPFRKLQPFSPAPAASALCTIDIPTGPTYYTLALYFKTVGVEATEAQFKSMVKWIRVKIGNIARIEVSGKHAVEILNKYYGITFANGTCYIPLARPWLKTPEAVENSAWGTRNVDKVTLEVEFDATAATPTMEAHAMSSLYSRDLGVIYEVHENTVSYAASGLQEFMTLPQTSGDLSALHLDSANVTACDIEIDRNLYMQVTNLPVYHGMVKWFALRQNQTGYVHFEAQMRDLMAEALPISQAKQISIKPTLSAAGTVVYISETLNAPLGLSSQSVN